MMGTLAAVLAGKEISTSANKYLAKIKGDIENVNGVLKIVRIYVQYHLKISQDQKGDAQNALNTYIEFCPAEQSVIDCIDIDHEMVFT